MAFTFLLLLCFILVQVESASKALALKFVDDRARQDEVSKQQEAHLHHPPPDLDDDEKAVAVPPKRRTPLDEAKVSSADKIEFNELNGITWDPSAVQDRLNFVFPKEEAITSVKDSVLRFIQKVEEIIWEINEQKSLYLESLENEKIAKILTTFTSNPCLGNNEFEDLKKLFRLRMGLLEIPLREAIVELIDKVHEIRRTIDLDRSILDIKLTTCEVVSNELYCANTSEPSVPCLNDSCSTITNIEIDSLFSYRNNSSPGVHLTMRNLLSTECDSGQFKCIDGQCINIQYVCDGQYDCTDHSDETTGCAAECSGKRCRNLQCISEDVICDGINDCGDGTDEEKCVNEDNCSLRSEGFACLNRNRCLPLSSVCDGKLDCTDGSDEGYNCSKSQGCEKCAVLGGSCMRFPWGPLCLNDCPSGFIFDAESGICILSNSTNALRIIYRKNSFFKCINKIKILCNRLNNGFTILKKRLNYELMKTALELNKCMLHNERGFRAPFEVLS